jgi:hypothetical protein
MAPHYFQFPGRHVYKEALRALRFLCDRGVKHFSQRALPLHSGRNVDPGKWIQKVGFLVAGSSPA